MREVRQVGVSTPGSFRAVLKRAVRTVSDRSAGGLGFVGQLSIVACVAAVLTVGLESCINPFAPRLDTSPAESACDPHTIEGMFQCFQAAYTFRDTTVYGPLIGQSFVFTFRNYDLGIDESWGRDDEMRSTYGLFQNAQKLDLIWNNVVSSATDSSTLNIVRGFNLTIVFSANDIERVDGYANLTFSRSDASTPWKIIRWHDESNY